MHGEGEITKIWFMDSQWKTKSVWENGENVKTKQWNTLCDWF